jgi:PAS domain S-box-containing protein
MLSAGRDAISGLVPFSLHPAPAQEKAGPGQTGILQTKNSLRVTTLIILSATFLALIILLALFSQMILLGGFSELEQTSSRQNIERVSYAIDGDIAKLDATGYAYSTAEDIQDSMRVTNPDTLTKNYGDEKLVGSGINILMIYHDGILVDHKYVSPESGHQMPTPKSLLSQISANSALIKHTSAQDRLNGIILLDSGPMLIASHPIMNPETGKTEGALVVGKYLDSAAIHDLSERTQLLVSVLPVNDLHNPPDVSAANGKIQAGEKVVITPISEQVIAGYAPVNDIFGNPVLTLRVEMPREIYHQGKVSVQYALFGLFLIGLVSALVTILLLEKTVLGRLAKLTARIRVIGQKGDFSSRIDFDGDDEIATVASSVNSMLESLDTSHRLLTKSEERYANVVEHANDMMFTCLLDGDITSANRMSEQVTGFLEHQLVNKNIYELLTPESAELVRTMWNPGTQDIYEQPRYEIVIETKNNDRRIIELSTQVQYEDNEPVGIFGIGRDITDRKTAEAELEKHRHNLEDLVQDRTRNLFLTNNQLKQEIATRQTAERNLAAEKQRLEVTLASIVDGVIATDTDSKIVLMNRVASGLTGCDNWEKQGLSLPEVVRLINAQSKSRITDTVESVMKSGQPVQIQHNLLLVNREGKEIPVVCSVAPIRNPDHSIVGTVIVLRDVSERMRWEDEMQRAAKLETVGTLAGGIAHDFNNILTAITGNISLAKLMTTEGTPLYTRLDSAEEATLKARSITQQLVTFSKGGAPIKEAADIKTLIRKTTDFVLSGTNSRAEISIAPDLYPVDADITQIGQVIGNLVINANQAMPQGGIVMVTAENVTAESMSPEDSDGHYVRISVKDHGVGIPEENLKKIFDPWFTTKKTGTGLGLASCQSIIQKHGGQMKVVSEVGVGTTFFVYLVPSKTRPVEEDQAPTEHAGSVQRKILLMDDDDNILIATGELLRHHGFIVKEARDGAEAIRIYCEEAEAGRPVDAVIMDLTVPCGMGGEECIARLKTLYPDVRCIVSSGYSDNEIMSNYLAYGFMDVLQKPYKIDTLIAKLHAMISSSGESEKASSSEAV